MREPDDLWLEDAEAEATRAFIERENERVEAALHDAIYEADVAFARSVLEDEDKLFVCRRRGDHLYDFHRDAAHPRGLWRRIPHDVTPAPDAPWETVFDLDAHCEATGGDWAWRGMADHHDGRVLIHLADGGSDVGVYREFDLATCAFVDGGFETPPARGNVDWEDADTLLVGLATEDHATRAGWPATVRRWRRGTALDDGEVLLRAGEDDTLVHGYAVGSDTGRVVGLVTNHDITGGATLEVMRGGERATVDLPTPRYAGASSRGVVWQPLEDTPDHPAGTLLVRPLPFDGEVEDTVLFTPGERRVVEFFWTCDRWLAVVIADNLAPELHMMDWHAPERELRRVKLPDRVETLTLSWHHATPDAANDHRGDIVVSGPIRPRTLLRFDPATFDRPPVEIARAKARFDAGAMRTMLLEARSDDGTMVPYHVTVPADGTPCPVVVNAYGGFGMSMPAPYMNLGALYYERGMGYCFAHIRGGAEFGPGWHRVARRQGRHKAFEDCAAIARDLVERGLASEGKVGMVGASNGGLLAGVMATRYPHLFGAIVAAVPVADMLRFHRFPAGRAWIDEYGDPDDPRDAAYLESYSPWHQVATEPATPPILVDAPINDDRVDPSHARRFAYRLREAGQPVHLRTGPTGGHGGGDASDIMARNAAAVAAFFRRTLLDGWDGR